MRRLVCGALLLLAACSSTPAPDAGVRPPWDEAEDRAMRAFLVERLKLPPEVAGRLRRLESRLHCGEYVDDVRRVGFIVGHEDGRFVLDAVGSPPRASVACQTYDDFIQAHSH
jgi:hypothetical protein